MNLRQLLNDIYCATGEIFVKTEFGVVFESVLIVDSDELCNPKDKLNGCGENYDVNTGLCASTYHKPVAPILIPANVDHLPAEFNPFPGNLYAVCSVLPTIKLLKGIKKQIIANFRRDFGDKTMRDHWSQNIKYVRYNVKNPHDNDENYGICDVIK